MYTKRRRDLSRVMRERTDSRFERAYLDESKKPSDDFEKFKERYHARRARMNEAWDDGIEDERARDRAIYNWSERSPESRYFSEYPDYDYEEEEEEEYFIPSEEDFAEILQGGDPEAVTEAAKIIYDWYTRQDYQDDYYDIDDFHKHGLKDIKDWVEEGDFTADHTPIIERALGPTKKEESRRIRRNVRFSEARSRRFPRSGRY